MNNYIGIAYYTEKQPSKNKPTLAFFKVLDFKSGKDQPGFYWVKFAVQADNIISLLKWLEELGEFEGLASLSVNNVTWVQMVDIPGTTLRRLYGNV